MDLFLIFSVLYLTAITALAFLVFLWILGAQKSRSDAAIAQPQPFPQTPSPSHQITHKVVPRRLSFSAATPTPTPGRQRRVTFNLTPEQARNEAIKTRPRMLVPEQETPLAELFPKVERRTTPRRRTAAPVLQDEQADRFTGILRGDEDSLASRFGHTKDEVTRVRRTGLGVR